MATNFHLGFKLLLFLGLLYCCYIPRVGEGAAEIVTDPQEVEALRTIAKKLQYTKWDFSIDPCSWKGSWNVDQDDTTANMVICNYTSGGAKFRHVTRILLELQNLSGVVPPELANLPYLEEIDLFGNYLNGTIPPELGSLTNLKKLSLGVNRLSGRIPKELGNLASLESLRLASNNLYGRLPRGLANLSKLQKLHIGNNRFHGAIPRSYSHLKALRSFIASSNDFGGKIPDFIGNWANIELLRVEGTSLKGPIPSTISKLSKLREIRISDLTGDGSNLSFMQNLTKLKTIVLRNALISGEIPEFIGDFTELKILDLRFNNLSGSIPDVLNNRKTYSLFLGNNNLNGAPHTWFNEILNIDLSYNKFSGDFPSSLKDKKSMNLIGNSFSNNLANIKISDQVYLQKGFTCDNGAPNNTFVAIKCGGEKWKTFEGDENPLGPSSYFLSPKKNWAVSSTGVFLGNEIHLYTVTANYSQFATGISPELYGKARCAPTSLRYYGLCLQNGLYNIQLHFAEIAISNEKSFTSLGRRIFDVYIQGNIKLKNFNIEDAAGGAYKVVVKNFTVNVTENYVEIHFFWAGKGTYAVPIKGTYGPLVSAIIITSEFKINNTKSKRSVIIGIVVGVVISLGLAVCLSFIFIKRLNGTKNRSMAARDDREFTNLNTISNIFSLEEIKNATGDFHLENKIGEGGFGVVFKGILPDGKMVAVKQMLSKSRQGNREFLNELGTISAVQHPNLVKFYGCCIEGKQLHLVYEYMENNSLARALFGPQEFRRMLNWPERYKICLGVAHGLAYLHEESTLRIVHRDIKSANILLDQHLSPKISDFGLAKLFDREKTHVSTRVAGTIGYMAPEYALKGQLTEKADVYSFGVVVLEVVSGRTHTEKTLPAEMVYLLEWTWQLHEEKRLVDLVDANLKNSSYSEEQVLRMMNIGLLCTHATPVLRPSMSTVVEMVEGRIDAHVSHSRPSYLAKWEPSVYIEEEEPLSRNGSLNLEGQWIGSSSF